MNDFPMTRYPRNSPRAAGRIVALALISNGKMQSSELAVLESRHANALLELSNEAWHEIVEELCTDLLRFTRRGPECLIDARLIEILLADVDDPALQRLVLRLCTEVANADGSVDDGEAIVLVTAVKKWGLHPPEQELLEPLLYGLDFQVLPRGALHVCETAAGGSAIRSSFLARAVVSSTRAR